MAAFGLMLPGGGLAAQQTTPSVNYNLVFLDAGHGGSDPGAHLSDKEVEKDVNLTLASKLKGMLSAKGLSVLSSRDGDQTVTSEQRADMANHARPLACLLVHTTSSGAGPYVTVSGLAPETGALPALPWETAQASYVTESLGLESVIVDALTNVAKLKPVVLRASVPPIDSLTCPAVLLELAPISGGTAASDADYQQRVADALTQALVAWHTQALDAVAKAKAAALAAKTPQAGSDGGKGAIPNSGTGAPKPRVVKPAPRVAAPPGGAARMALPAEPAGLLEAGG